MERLREIIAIVNDKGGVGKTTTVQNLAAGLIRYGKGYFGKDENGKQRTPRILVIDLDAQEANLSLLEGWRSMEHIGQKTMFDALSTTTSIPVYKVKDNLYLAPSSPQLINIDPFLQQQLNPLKVLCKIFALPVTLEKEDGGTQSIIEAFDYILIDCPPAMNNITKNAMAVATGIIVPMQLEALATFGSSSVIKWAQEIKEELNPNLELRGILKVMVDERTKVSKAFSKHIDEEYADYVFKAVIPRRTKMVEAHAMLNDIFEYSPYDGAGIGYEQFSKEILNSYTEE